MPTATPPDAVALSLFASQVSAICEEMGAVLGRTALSPNVRDRLDYSCALFDADGRLLGQATHIPVHLGSMAFAMRGLVERREWRPGDVLVVNDPFSGGTHLPDVTLIEPVFIGGRCVGFCANRAHHADIGANAPGSMPASDRLDEEGLVIPPTWLERDGERNVELLDHWMGRVARPEIARGDLSAQRTANRTGRRRLAALVEPLGREAFGTLSAGLQSYAERLAAAELARIPGGRYEFTDVLDDDGHGHEDVPIAIRVDVKEGRVHVDFEGTAAQVRGNVNCPMPVTAAAVHYVFRCLMPPQTPACDGAMKRITLSAPRGSLVNAEPPAAVAAGNVETSMRIVDTVCGALAKALPGRIPAASQGTMNNVAMGSRGDGAWDYYETLAGGCGAGPGADGATARHSHMTNTLNTPVEILERHYPVRVERYAVRRGSGGDGRHRGGDGIVRSYRFLAPASVSLLTERRRHGPWPLQGGEAGEVGENRLDGEVLPPKCMRDVAEGALLEIRTPGGGGYGDPE